MLSPARMRLHACVLHGPVLVLPLHTDFVIDQTVRLAQLRNSCALQLSQCNRLAAATESSLGAAWNCVHANVVAVRQFQLACDLICHLACHCSSCQCMPLKPWFLACMTCVMTWQDSPCFSRRVTCLDLYVSRSVRSR